MKYLKYILYKISWVLIDYLQPYWLLVVAPWASWSRRVVYSYYTEHNLIPPLLSKYLIKPTKTHIRTIHGNTYTRVYTNRLLFMLAYYLVWMWLDDLSYSGLFRHSHVVANGMRSDANTRLTRELLALPVNIPAISKGDELDRDLLRITRFNLSVFRYSGLDNNSNFKHTKLVTTNHSKVFRYRNIGWIPTTTQHRHLPTMYTVI